jgi:hypothetical protein
MDYSMFAARYRVEDVTILAVIACMLFAAVAAVTSHSQMSSTRFTEESHR